MYFIGFKADCYKIYKTLSLKDLENRSLVFLLKYQENNVVSCFGTKPSVFCKKTIIFLSIKFSSDIK